MKKFVIALIMAMCAWWIITCICDMWIETMEKTSGTMLEEEILYYSFIYPIIAGVIAFAVTLRVYWRKGS